MWFHLEMWQTSANADPPPPKVFRKLLPLNKTIGKASFQEKCWMEEIRKVKAALTPAHLEDYIQKSLCLLFSSPRVFPNWPRNKKQQPCSGSKGYGSKQIWDCESPKLSPKKTCPNWRLSSGKLTNMAIAIGKKSTFFPIGNTLSWWVETPT